jgi:hypothetical protein
MSLQVIELDCVFAYSDKLGYDVERSMEEVKKSQVSLVDTIRFV